LLPKPELHFASPNPKKEDKKRTTTVIRVRDKNNSSKKTPKNCSLRFALKEEVKRIKTIGKKIEKKVKKSSVKTRAK